MLKIVHSCHDWKHFHHNCTVLIVCVFDNILNWSWLNSGMLSTFLRCTCSATGDSNYKLLAKKWNTIDTRHIIKCCIYSNAKFIHAVNICVNRQAGWPFCVTQWIVLRSRNEFQWEIQLEKICWKHLCLYSSNQGHLKTTPSLLHGHAAPCAKR